MSNATELSMVNKKAIAMARREAYDEKPLDVNAQNVIRTAHYKDYLYRLVVGSWKWDFDQYLNWNYAYAQENLLLNGGFAVAKVHGAILQFPFGVKERTIQHMPHTISSSDGNIIADRLVVGEDCVIVSLGFKDMSCTGMWNYRSIIDIYAQRLADCDASIDINLMNCRTPFLFECSDAKEALSMKALYTRISQGEPAVYWRSNKMRETLDKRELPITVLPVKENYIADKIVEIKRAIVSDFLTKIGVNNVDFEKKERLNVDETNSNKDALDCAISLWRDNVFRGIRQANEMFGLNLSIAPRMEGGEINDRS